MAISGVGSTPEPNDKNYSEVSDNKNQTEESKFSIFDTDKDGTVTVSEQQQAIRNVAQTNSVVKEAIEKGFNLEIYVDTLGELCEDIITNAPKTIGKLILTPKDMVAYANRAVQKTIDHIIEKANEFLQSKNVDKASDEINKTE